MQKRNMKYAKDLLEVIGNTPLVKLNTIVGGIDALVLAKLEYLNPGGSMKDRIGITMIEDGEKKGLLKKGGLIVEPTSGNTGVGLAIVAAIRGYKVIFTMSWKMSMEKEMMLRAYGAEVVRAPADVGPDDPRHYINVAKQIAKDKGGYFPNQYFNKANILARFTDLESKFCSLAVKPVLDLGIILPRSDTYFSTLAGFL